MDTTYNLNQLKVVLVCLFLSSVSTFSFAQKISPYFRNYTLNEGVSQSTISDIHQDSDGFIWIGTEEGLNRFDGYQFKVFRRNSEDSTSLSSNYILSIFEDNNSRLWIGTYGGGLNLFNKKTNIFKRFQEELNNPNSLSNNTVKCIYQDSKENLWIGTVGGGLNLWNEEKETFTSFKHEFGNHKTISNNRINCITEGKNGNLWVGTEYGLNLFNPSTGENTIYLSSNSSLINNSINSICRGSNNTLWIGTQNGINLFDMDKNTFLPTHSELSNLDINDLIYHDGHIWIGTTGEGVFFFDSATNTLQNIRKNPANPTSLTGNVILKIFKDNADNLWFGSRANGLSFLEYTTLFFNKINTNNNLPNALRVNRVHGFNQTENGKIWVSTFGGGLHVMDKKTLEFKVFSHDPDDPTTIGSNQIWVTYVDNENKLWLGTRGGGLNLYNPGSQSFTRFNHDPKDSTTISDNVIRSIFQDTEGILWVGTDGQGLNKYNRATNTFQHFRHNPQDTLSISNDYIFHIFQTEKDKIWIGTNGGLNLFNKKDSTFKHFKSGSEPNTISSNRIRSMYLDSKNRFWIGTSSGLNLYNPEDESFKRWQENDGLSNNVIYGILEDDLGSLWLSTNKGINKFNPETNEIIQYDVNDGLQANEFNNYSYFKDKEGLMYFGGVNGFNMFLPEKIVENKTIPPIKITNFLYFNKEVEVVKNVSLSTDENALIKTEEKVVYLPKPIEHTQYLVLDDEDQIFGFEFTALNYRQPEKNKYKYKLEKFNDDWIETDYLHRRATYSKVPPGKYTFKVKASNDDGYWSETAATISIRILPPWWLTWWMKLLYVLTGVVTPILFFYYRIKLLNKNKEELEKTVNDRTYEILQQKEELEVQAEELRIINDKLTELDSFREAMTGMIVHDLKNPLNAIIGLTEESYKKEHQATLNQSGKAMLNLVTNILEVQKFEEANMNLTLSSQRLSIIIENAIAEVQLLIKEKNHFVNIDITTTTWVKVDINLIQRVFVNLLTNAIKYTPVNGEVTVYAKITDDGFVEVTIEDTGIGISPNELPLIFNKFKQINRKNSGKTRSTGLGLTFCKMAIEAHDCSIKVESTLKVGTKFSFTLPHDSYEVLEVNQPKESDTPAFQHMNHSFDLNQLSPDDKLFLSPFIKEIKVFEVYDVSSVRKILKKINSENAKVKEWSTAVEKTLYTCNEREFSYLVTL